MGVAVLRGGDFGERQKNERERKTLWLGALLGLDLPLRLIASQVQAAEE